MSSISELLSCNIATPGYMVSWAYMIWVSKLVYVLKDLRFHTLPDTVFSNTLHILSNTITICTYISNTFLKVFPTRYSVRPVWFSVPYNVQVHVYSTLDTTPGPAQAMIASIASLKCVCLPFMLSWSIPFPVRSMPSSVHYPVWHRHKRSTWLSNSRENKL